MKGKLFLIHWNKVEAEEYASNLRDDDWRVQIEAEDGGRAVRLIKTEPPGAVVIYLTRVPSHVRETADGLRAMNTGRHLPIVFVDGVEEALEKTKAKVPDAIFTTSADLKQVLEELLQTQKATVRK